MPPLVLLRSLIFVPIFYLTTALFVVGGSFLLLGPRRYAMAGLRAHARVSLWLLKWIVGTKMEVRGREKLPDAPYLVASKHQSAWDTFALIPIFHDPAMVMKAELRAHPVSRLVLAQVRARVRQARPRARRVAPAVTRRQRARGGWARGGDLSGRHAAPAGR